MNRLWSDLLLLARRGTHPGPSGHPSEEGSRTYPFLGGVPRQRRGGFRRPATPIDMKLNHPRGEHPC